MMAAVKAPEYREAKGFIAEIIRTERRKTADIRVEDGAVSVVVPINLALSCIDELLKTKRKWIREKLSLQQEAQPVSEKQFVSGESFPYLGRNYRLKVHGGEFQPVKLLRGYLHVTVPDGVRSPQMVRNALIRWYKAQAERKLLEKVARFAPVIGVNPKSISVRSFKSRWGSCSAKGDIQFNWRVVMAPNSVCDYVVTHELCHLVHHDHSPEFWGLLERHKPDFLIQKRWLKENEQSTNI
jgi:predicted metal-dependent hydrolase